MSAAFKDSLAMSVYIIDIFLIIKNIKNIDLLFASLFLNQSSAFYIFLKIWARLTPLSNRAQKYVVTKEISFPDSSSTKLYFLKNTSGS